MKQFGAKRSRASRWQSVPLRLVLITVAAASALVTQFVMHNTGSLPEINLQNLIKPKPVAIGGVASVIDGDTIEVHGQRIRLNGIDAPESRQYCDDAKRFEYSPWLYFGQSRASPCSTIHAATLAPSDRVQSPTKRP